MSKTVTITAGDNPVDVISEKIIEDGRQRLPNGVDRLEAGEAQAFIIHGRQSLRVVEVAEDAAPEADQPTLEA